MMTTICTHPAGEDGRRTCLVFSPHPDDDVISMGGTIIRLVEQGHKVHVAYMTSGNIAVFDHDAWRFTDFVCAFNELFGLDQPQTEGVKCRVQAFLACEEARSARFGRLLNVKGLIRETEAHERAALACGVPPEQLTFMDLRFYRTGTIAKAPIHTQDIDDIAALLNRLRPTQIYVAGELSDPHGTHRICAEAVFEAVRRVRRSGQDFEVWLYRGAWEEWEPHEIERVVPLSPSDLEPRSRRSSAINRKRTRRCSQAAAIRASSGSAPRTAIAIRPSCTINLACRSFTPSKVSCSGAASRASGLRRYSPTAGVAASAASQPTQRMNMHREQR